MKNSYNLHGVEFESVETLDIKELEKKYIIHHTGLLVTARHSSDRDNKISFRVACRNIDDILLFKGITVYFYHEDIIIEEKSRYRKYIKSCDIDINPSLYESFNKMPEELKLIWLRKGHAFVLFDNVKDYLKFKIKL